MFFLHPKKLFTPPKIYMQRPYIPCCGIFSSWCCFIKNSLPSKVNLNWRQFSIESHISPKAVFLWSLSISKFVLQSLSSMEVIPHQSLSVIEGHLPAKGVFYQKYLNRYMWNASEFLKYIPTPPNHADTIFEHSLKSVIQCRDCWHSVYTCSVFTPGTAVTAVTRLHLHNSG